jgi:hypothetical protein
LTIYKNLNNAELSITLCLGSSDIGVTVAVEEIFHGAGRVLVSAQSD